jgi:hypothetical protein
MMAHDKEDEQQEQPSLLSLEGVERIRRVMHEGQEYWSVVVRRFGACGIPVQHGRGKER